MATDKWKQTNLDERVNLLTGFPFKSAQYTEDPNGIPLVRGDNVVQGTFRWDDVKRWSRDQIDGLSEYFLNPGDVVLAMDRPWIEAGLKYACVSEHDVPCLLVQRVSRLRAKDTLDQRFLRYVIGSSEFTNYILGVQTGTAVPHISGGQIKQYQFLLPPLPEQRAIAGILGALDDKIELNRRMNRTLESMARAMFRQWFVESMEVSKWGTSKIGELAELDKGVSYKGAFLTDKGMPMINLGCFLGKGRFEIDKLKTYSGEYKERHTVKPGDIVLANTDITQKREVIGSPAIVPDYPAKEYLFTHHTYALRVSDDSPILKHYLYFTLLQEEFRERAEGFATGTTVLALPRDAVLDYEIPMPPSNELQSFYKQVQPMLQLVQSNIKESRTLASLRDSLLPKLMRGEVRVKE